MPLYDWRCICCQEMNEVIRPMSEYNVPPDECNECGGHDFEQIVIRPDKVKGFILKEGGAGGFHQYEYTKYRSIK